MNPRPLVFDCDGVLVDSEELAWTAWRDALEPFGIEVTGDEVAALSGRTEADAYTYFSTRGPLPPYDEFWPVLGENIYRVFECSLEAFEDAVDTLDVLHRKGRALAVASSSPRRRLDLSLASTGLARFFPVVVAGDDVERGKPAPDIYLRAAELLGVDPSGCVAVEDAPSGIAAAKAAGMRVIAVQRGFFETSALGAADVIVPRLTPAALAE